MPKRQSGRANRPHVSIRVPTKPLFVGSYHYVPVELDGGIDLDELTFTIPDGAKGGIVSPSRDSDVDRERPRIMLCVGYEPGTYAIEARETATGRVVGEEKFSVDALWRDEDLGPSRWFTGTQRARSAGSAWGGGPGGVQNAGTIAASGTRRIAVLLVDTSTQRFTTNNTALQGHRDRWMDELINGVTQGGTTRSARAFFRESSHNTFDISARVFGPVSLPGTFDDYFNADGTPKGTYFQACFTAGDSLINYNNFDTLLCVSQSVTGASARSAWPYASIGRWGAYTTAEGDKDYGVISMPNEWGVAGNREIHETFSHELGHNLGMGDQYTPAVPGRNPGGWEMMDSDDPFPHYSVAHLLELGWVKPGWVQGFNFQSMAAPVDQTVTLSPIETGAPASGRKSAVEVRLADGWNYYFEYRRGQAAQIADRNLPTDDRVLGTDVVSGGFAPPISRPKILLLHNDVDGDGAVLGNGQDYEETDTSDPVFPTDFKVDVSAVNGSSAKVRVRYGVNSRPDPSIRPWPASSARPWQSPDIEVRNPRSEADSAWTNVPWVGNPNTVIARVKNNGALDATQVRVNFFVKNLNVGGVPETFLGTDVRDVPAGETVQFQSTWKPPSDGHFCIVVRIPLYQLPANPAVVEMTELNNLAQSNYDRFISATSTPSREVREVEVGNPYPERTRIFLVAGHNNPLYRTYLEHAWLYLDPGETRMVRVMFEYAPDHLENDLYSPARRKKYQSYREKPNRVALTSFIEDPRDYPRHAIQVLGGIQTEVVTGRSTRFGRFSVEGREVEGAVVHSETGKPVDGGEVLLRVTSGRGKQATVHFEPVTPKTGTFKVELKEAGGKVKAYFIPPPGLADCESEELRAG